MKNGRTFAPRARGKRRRDGFAAVPFAAPTWRCGAAPCAALLTGLTQRRGAARAALFAALLVALGVASAPALASNADDADNAAASSTETSAVVLIGAPGVASPLLAADGEVGAPRAGSGVDPAAARIVERMLAEIRGADEEPRRLGLADAVRFAIENNPGLRSRADIPGRDAQATLRATGAFDPKLRAEALASDITTPASNALVSGSAVRKEEAVRSEVSISKLLRSGAVVDLAWTSNAFDTNSAFYLVDPGYDNRLALTLRQPLLRNLWASEENTTVLVARSQAGESLAAFEAELSRFVHGVVTAYWGHVRASAELEVSRRAVALAAALVGDAQAKADAGVLPRLAIQEARADAAAREEKAMVAENALLLAGRDLQYQVMLGALESRGPAPVLPVEEHVVTPVELDRASSLTTAAQSRAEIRGASLALERRRLEERRARNRRLPALDLVARYGRLGLAGDVQTVLDLQGNPIVSPQDGGYGDSLGSMFSDGFDEYAIGLRVEVPFGNASARADVLESEIEVRRAARDLEQAISSVALEVDRAIADVASAAKRVTASKATRELAEENLRHQSSRYDLGTVTTKDVLDYQERLAEAQAAEVRAITDHALALTRLRMAEGTLLARFGVEVRSPQAPDQPWWYRF